MERNLDLKNLLQEEGLVFDGDYRSAISGLLGSSRQLGGIRATPLMPSALSAEQVVQRQHIADAEPITRVIVVVDNADLRFLAEVVLDSRCKRIVKEQVVDRWRTVFN